MDGSTIPQIERETQRAQVNRHELIERVAQTVPDDGPVEPMKGVHLARLSRPRAPVHYVMEPSFCVIAQGSKEVLMGGNRYRYDPFHYLLTTVEMPSVSQVLEATDDCPYLSLRLELDPALVGAVMVEAGQRQGVEPNRISFVDALRWLRQARPGAAMPRLKINAERPGRCEPRVRKRRTKHYTLMKKPRAVLREALLDQAVADKEDAA